MADTPVESRKISFRTSRVDDFAELSISDNGPGIPENRLKQVFEPFFTSKAEGMGMGLSIARTIVEAHNGRIAAETHLAAARCSGSHSLSTQSFDRGIEDAVGSACRERVNRSLLSIDLDQGCGSWKPIVCLMNRGA